MPSLHLSLIVKPLTIRGTQLPELEVWDWDKKKPIMIQVEKVRDLLLHLDWHKSMRPDGIQPRLLKELADVIAGLLSIIYQRSWSSREVSDDLRLANVRLYWVWLGC